MKLHRQRIQDSYIVRFFVFLTNFVYHSLSAGFLGRIFTAYTATDNAFRASGAGRLVHASERRNGKLFRAFRRNAALAMSRSVIINGVRELVQRFYRCSLRTLGLFLVTSGSYSAMMYWLFSVIWQNGAVGILNLYCGIGMLILGILLLFSDVSLGYALQRGVFFGRILSDALGVSDDALRNVEKTGKNAYVIAVPLGMVLGAVCALISPFYLIAAGVALLLFLLVLSVPEAGVVLLILFLPFAGFLPNADMWLLVATALPVVSYLLKLLRGNRAVHVEVQDIPVVFMVALFALSGFSMAGGSAWRGALLSALFAGVYFLVVNVIATPRWMTRCRVALIIAATSAALLGLFQFVLAAVVADAVSLPVLGAAVRAGFTDHTTLAYFLVVVFPFVISTFINAQKQYRLLVGFSMVSMVLAIALTWVQSAWIALVLILVVFFLLYEHRVFPFVLLGGVLAPVAFWVMPIGVRGKLLAFLRVDSSAAIAGGISAGDVASNALLSSGFSRFVFGLGYGGIDRICMLYTTAAPTVLSGSLSFWTYRLLEGGVLGTLLPAVFFFLLCQNCFSLLRAATGRSAQLSAITGVTLVAGVVALSLFRYAWYDPAALLCFFIATALIAADARYHRAREAVPSDKMTEDENAVEMEYYGKA